MDRQRLVHVVFVTPDRSRSWFVRTDRRFDKKTGTSTTWPVVGSEPRESVPMAYEYATACKAHWSVAPFNLTVRLSLEAGPHADFIDEENGVPLGQWEFKDVLVTCRETGEPFDSLDAPCCLKVRAVLTPQGKQFVLRADPPSLIHPSVFSSLEEGPEVAVQKAWDLGFRGYPTIPNPMIERRRQEAERQGQRVANARFANVRPGDRYEK